MKTLFIFAATVAAASLLSACQQDPQSANQPLVLPQGTSSSSTPAHPAITYPSVVAVHSSNYNTVGVMDTDGTHQTDIVTASTTYETLRNTCWNYSGGSITYRDYGSSSSSLYPSSIKTTNVTLNSKGVPVGSTPSTIYTLNSSDDAYVGNGLAWCSTSSTAQIAFVRQHTGSQNGLSELCTISQSGGTVTVLASYQKLNTAGTVTSYFTSPTWSPDDSKIAVFREDTIGHVTIMIFDASTGAATDSIPMSLSNMNHLEWSRTGANLLAFAVLSSGGYSIYYCAPTTGSTPSTNSVAGSFPTWSPNNSSLMYVATASSNKLMKVTQQTNSTAQLTTGGPTGAWLNWKR
jgi:hypothetical protein